MGMISPACGAPAWVKPARYSEPRVNERGGCDISTDEMVVCQKQETGGVSDQSTYKMPVDAEQTS